AGGLKNAQQVLALKEPDPVARHAPLRQAEGARMLAAERAMAVIRAPERLCQLEQNAATQTASPQPLHHFECTPPLPCAAEAEDLVETDGTLVHVPNLQKDALRVRESRMSKRGLHQLAAPAASLEGGVHVEPLQRAIARLHVDLGNRHVAELDVSHQRTVRL